MRKYLIFSLIFLAMIACQQKSGRPDNPSSKDQRSDAEADIRLVRVLGASSETDTNYQFLRPSDVKSDPQGSIYVIDSGSNRIQKYDHALEYVQTIGRKGQGPGEFNWPRYFDINREGQLYVFDFLNEWV